MSRAGLPLSPCPRCPPLIRPTLSPPSPSALRRQYGKQMSRMPSAPSLFSLRRGLASSGSTSAAASAATQAAPPATNGASAMDLDEDDHDAAEGAEPPAGPAAALAAAAAPAASEFAAAGSSGGGSHITTQAVQAVQRETRDKRSGKRRVQPMMMTSPSRPAPGGGSALGVAAAAAAAATAALGPPSAAGGIPIPSSSGGGAVSTAALQRAAAAANAHGWSDSVALAAAAREAQSLSLPAAKLGGISSGANRAVRVKLQGSAPGRLELRGLASRKGLVGKGRSVGEVSYVVDCKGAGTVATPAATAAGAEAAVEVRWRLLLGYLPVAAVGDASRAVVATSDGAVHVLSSATGVRLLPPLLPGRGVALLRLRNERLLVVTTDGELLVWHLGRRRLERRLPLAPLLPAGAGPKRKKAKGAAGEAADADARRSSAEHEQLADVDVTGEGEVLAYKSDATVGGGGATWRAGG